MSTAAAVSAGDSLGRDWFCPSVVPECLSNKVLIRLTVTLILEIISLGIFPFVGSGKTEVLHISRDTCSPVE